MYTAPKRLKLNEKSEGRGVKFSHGNQDERIIFYGTIEEVIDEDYALVSIERIKSPGIGSYLNQQVMVGATISVNAYHIVYG